MGFAPENWLSLAVSDCPSVPSSEPRQNSKAIKAQGTEEADARASLTPQAAAAGNKRQAFPAKLSQHLKRTIDRHPRHHPPQGTPKPREHPRRVASVTRLPGSSCQDKNGKTQSPRPAGPPLRMFTPGVHRLGGRPAARWHPQMGMMQGSAPDDLARCRHLAMLASPCHPCAPPSVAPTVHPNPLAAPAAR